ELTGGQSGGVPAEEQLQGARVAQFADPLRGFPAPALELFEPLLREAVDATAATRLLALLDEQSALGEPRALSVDLGVRDRPEVVRRDLRRALEVIRGPGAGVVEQAEHDEGGLRETR